jgi:hypothetical protein
LTVHKKTPDIVSDVGLQRKTLMGFFGGSMCCVPLRIRHPMSISEVAHIQLTLGQLLRELRRLR